MFPPVERVIEWKRDYLELQMRFVRAALVALQEKTLGSHETVFPNVIPPQKRRDWRVPPSGAVFRHTGELDSLRVSVNRACDADDKRGEAASAQGEEDKASHDDQPGNVSLQMPSLADASTEYSDTESEFVWDWETIEAHALSDS